MKLIIDISDDLYKTKMTLPDYMCGIFENAVQNGVPLEQIRAEIETEHDDLHSECKYEDGWSDALDWVLEVIDKYTGVSE